MLKPIPVILAGAMLLLNTLPLYAEEDFQPIDELFQTELVFPQEEGEFGIVLSPAYLKQNNGDSFLLPVTFEYGLTRALQIEIEWQALVRTMPDQRGNDNGTGNLEVGFKYAWMDIDRAGLNIAVGMEHTFGIGDKDVVEDKDEDEIYVIIARDLDSWADRQISIQLGMEAEDDENETFVNLAYYSKQRDLVWTMEYNWSEEEKYLTPGIAFQPADEMEVGAGLALGTNDEADDFRLLSHISVEFN